MIWWTFPVLAASVEANRAERARRALHLNGSKEGRVEERMEGEGLVKADLAKARATPLADKKQLDCRRPTQYMIAEKAIDLVTYLLNMMGGVEGRG